MITNAAPLPAIGANGAAVPAWSLLSAGKDGSGNQQPLSVSSGGVLNVAFGGVAHDAVLTGVNPILQGFYASTSTPTAVSAAGDMVQGWADLVGRIAIWDGNANLSIDDGGNSITVDGAVTVSGTATVSGTVTANAGTGFPAVATAGSAVAATGHMAYGTDGTNARAALMDSSGRQIVIGAAATDAAVAGNPLYMGGFGSTATPTAMSADGDMTPLWLTRNGAVNIADGGSSITVDGSVTVSGTATVSGTVTANAGTGFPGVATDGSAVVATGYQMMGTDGTNAQTLSVSTTGVLNVALPQASTATNAVIDCLVTNTVLLSSAGTRKGFMIVNNSPITTIYLGVNSSVGLGTTAGANRGLAIGPYGSCNMSTFAGYTGDIYGIADGATAKVGVMYW